MQVWFTSSLGHLSYAIDVEATVDESGAEILAVRGEGNAYDFSPYLTAAVIRELEGEALEAARKQYEQEQLEWSEA